MTFLEAAQAPLRKYFDFSGRSSRKEYWSFAASVVLTLIAIAVVASVAPSIIFVYFGVALGLIIPHLAVAVRRLHDSNRSGVWLLANFIPYVGILFFLYFMAKAGDPGANQYGPNPYDRTGEQALPPAAPSADGWVAGKS